MVGNSVGQRCGWHKEFRSESVSLYLLDNIPFSRFAVSEEDRRSIYKEWSCLTVQEPVTKFVSYGEALTNRCMILVDSDDGSASFYH